MSLRPYALALFGLLAGGVLGGCAVMDADDCARADWRRLGEQDARQGYLLDRLGVRAKACQEHGRAADRMAYEAGHRDGQRIYCSAARGQDDAMTGRKPAKLCLAPPQTTYEQGYDQGLQRFCRARSAYEHGRAGGDDPQTCPEAWRLDFETGHRIGREVRDMEQRRQQLVKDISVQRQRAEDKTLKPEEREQAKRRAVELEQLADRLRSQQRRLEIQALSLPR